MIKKIVSYTDYNNKPQTEELYFHAPKHVLMDHMDLKEQFERLSDVLDGDEPRELNRDEVNDILQLVKRLIRISYGVRTDSGRKFRQTDEDWAEFQSSAAYDAFLWSMFDKPEQAFAFMRGIMPDDLMEQAAAQAELDKSGPRRPQDYQKKAVTQAPSVPTVSENETVEFDDAQVEGETATDVEETPDQKRARLEAELAAL